jgi:hypothetical protein
MPSGGIPNMLQVYLETLLDTGLAKEVDLISMSEKIHFFSKKNIYVRHMIFMKRMVVQQL